MRPSFIQYWFSSIIAVAYAIAVTSASAAPATDGKVVASIAASAAPQ